VRREKRTSNFIAIACHTSVRRYPPENWKVTTGVQSQRPSVKAPAVSHESKMDRHTGAMESKLPIQVIALP